MFETMKMQPYFKGHDKFLKLGGYIKCSAFCKDGQEFENETHWKSFNKVFLIWIKIGKRSVVV